MTTDSPVSTAYTTYHKGAHVNTNHKAHADGLVHFDHATEPLYGAETTYQENPELYQTEWVPKINAYRQAIVDAIPKEYLVPQELLAGVDLDNDNFNATLIPAKVLDEESLKITESTATELVAKIASGEYTSVQVTTAFIKRATIAHQLTNCGMEILFKEGLARAKELDEIFAKTGKTVGPLHGLPVSLKEHYYFKGRVTTGGYVCNLTNVTPEHGVTTLTLEELGAVFYIRTSNPQSLMHLCSYNNITGRTRNPWNTSLSPGGSSSGEGAISGMKAAPLSVGTDIGGSIRAPAAFCGGFGLKPTTHRISMAGGVGGGEAAYNTIKEGVGCSMGPMANSVEDLELFMKAYLDSEPWVAKDQQLIPVPWREVPVPKPQELTIGIVYDDGVVKPHPPVVRALKEVAAKLKAAGVNVVEWESYEVYQVAEICNVLYDYDGNYSSLKKFSTSGEPLAELTKHALKFGKGDYSLSVREANFYVNSRESYRQKYQDLFNSRGVDFLIAPTYVGTAPKPNTVHYWGYTSLWNLLDQTCVTFPSRVFADKNIDVKDVDYKPRNEHEEYEYNLYDAEKSHGSPVGLTLVGRRYTEEKALKAMKVIDEIISA
ncbi:hypothetical protein WICPIJ_009502 [Wickerhamomyces pijperi]|uniref:Amidase domain-containing protein n=1 Tax=Wickerhamomyces pijperi TaxID=599730 RepID=A0A9P8PP19_WICPI|nr:hypothetical protein WICPIJ_009502 [Wickerhamomyces pijperi]